MQDMEVHSGWARNPGHGLEEAKPGPRGSLTQEAVTEDSHPMWLDGNARWRTFVWAGVKPGSLWQREEEGVFIFNVKIGIWREQIGTGREGGSGRRMERRDEGRWVGGMSLRSRLEDRKSISLWQSSASSKDAPGFWTPFTSWTPCPQAFIGDLCQLLRAPSPWKPEMFPISLASCCSNFMIV